MAPCQVHPGSTLGGVGLFGAVVRDTWNILVPVQCVVCGEADRALCNACHTGLARDPVTVEFAIRRELYGLPVLAAGHYRGALREAVLSFKDHGYHPLAKPLASLLEPAVRDVVTGEDALLVPIPSSRRGWIRRGFEPTVLLAKALHTHAPTLHPRRVLRRGGGVRQLIGRQRKSLARAERLHRQPVFTVVGDVTGVPVWILDDVSTTGRSLEQAAKTLTAHGAIVRGALVIAAHSTID